MKEKSITCPICHMTSYNTNDIENGYCGNCHQFYTRKKPSVDSIKAPWTKEQVDRANRYQKSGVFHPFTCSHCRDNLGVPPEHKLVATESGWVCPTCDYTQDWAWDMQVEFDEQDWDWRGKTK